MVGKGNPHQTVSWIVLEEKIVSHSRFLLGNLLQMFPNGYDKKMPIL